MIGVVISLMTASGAAAAFPAIGLKVAESSAGFELDFPYAKLMSHDSCEVLWCRLFSPVAVPPW